MVINFVTNTFGRYKRQDISVDSWRYIISLFKNSKDIKINWYNFQFKSEEKTFVDHYDGIQTVFCLEDSVNKVPGATKNLPFVNEMYEHALTLEGDYFVIHNSDVIVMPHLIGFLNDVRPESWSASRMDIKDIDSFSDIIKQNVVPVDFNVGHDLFVFDKTWATNNRSLFLDQYLMGSPVFDMVWAAIIKVFGDNKPMGNSYPPYLFHIQHPDTWLDNPTPERNWNERLTKNNPLNMILLNIINYNILENLSKRTPKGTFLTESGEEKSWEIDFFNKMSYSRPVF